MKVYLGADHRGYKLKEKIGDWLSKWGYEFEDLGNAVLDSKDDYPDWGGKVGEAVGLDSDSRGVVICGSGVGVNIAVNKFKGIRGMIGFDSKQVEHGVVHDHANVLSLASDYFKDKKVKEMVKVFLESSFGGEERCVRRVNKINKIETKYFLN